MNDDRFPAFPAIAKAVAGPKNPPEHLGGLKTYVDMFCGIGGFHLAASTFGMQCVFASDIDDDVRKVYKHNYGIEPVGDISRIKAEDVPDHDLFCAGFPCQPFSIIGKRQGFADMRGTLFFEIIRILTVKRPRAVILENVKQLATADKGNVLCQMISELRALDYHVDTKVLNALDYGLPQKRERILIVGTQDPFDKFPWPKGDKPMKPLSEILEPDPPKRFFVSERIFKSRKATHESDHKPSIWHENKAGNVSSYPYSCALRAGASYNYLLVNGERRLTPREMHRLQGFPDSFEIISTDSQARKQAGNAVPVPLIVAGIEGILNVIRSSEGARHIKSA